MDIIARLLHAHSLVGAHPGTAEVICRQVLEVEPTNGFALHLLGVLRLRQGESAEAQSLLRRAVAQRPDNVESRIALAEALVQDEQDAQAAAELVSVLALQPGYGAVLSALSVVRLRMGEPVVALALATEARAADPANVEPLVALGTALSALRRSREAREVLAEAVGRDPAHGHAHLNLGNVLLNLDEEAAAETHLRRAVALRPRSPEAWASLGFLLAGTDRLTEAVRACDAAIALKPDFAQAYWNRSFAELRAGRFEQGWADYEWRHRHPTFRHAAHVLPGPEWDGGALTGRRLLVNATQGLGDTIQLARYLPLLAARGAEVTLRCAEPLIGLLRTLSVRVVDRGDPAPPYDVWVDQMSLPGRFGTTPETIPSAHGYLIAAPHVDGRPARAGVRVGVACAGNPLHSNDFRRSMPAADMARLADVPGVVFSSLQAGAAAAELAGLFDVPDEISPLSDLAATAQRIMGLDLVITVDTAVAHLAGALGKPVWILLPRAPDWRWLAGRDDSPWYASARLFRQDRAGDWDGVVARVAIELARRVAEANRAARPAAREVVAIPGD